MKTTDPNVLIKHIGKVIDKKMQKIKAATAANAHELAAKAKGNAPVDLGKLKQGIQASQDTARNNDGVHWRVVATEKYSPYVEFGTGDKVEVPPGLQDWAMQFYVNGEGTTPAHAFMFPAFKVQSKQYIADLKKILDE